MSEPPGKDHSPFISFHVECHTALLTFEADLMPDFVETFQFFSRIDRFLASSAFIHHAHLASNADLSCCPEIWKEEQRSEGVNEVMVAIVRDSISTRAPLRKGALSQT